MAGTRRGAERKQNSDAFEAANPFLTRVDTRIEVAPREEDEGPKKPVKNEKFEVRVIEDGVEVDGFVNVDNGRVGPVRTLADEVETPVGELDAADFFDGPPRAIKVVLSEEGFGVGRKGEAQGGPLENEHYALDGGESLEFDVQPGGGGPFVVFPDFYGGTDFGVDFKVLEGSGSVEITLLQESEGLPIWVGSGGSGSVSGDGSTGSVDADLLPGAGLFDYAVIEVTGDLMVSITGIDVTTNFSGMGIFEPI